jgi:methylmalonyl-CoA mutase N-terminal domain/subunit
MENQGSVSAPVNEKKFQYRFRIEIQQVYKELHIPIDEDPGSFPFTRGIHASMYRDKLWQCDNMLAFPLRKKSNKRYRYLLNQGTTGLSVAFDLPTQIGYDLIMKCRR